MPTTARSSSSATSRSRGRRSRHRSPSGPPVSVIRPWSSRATTTRRSSCGGWRRREPSSSPTRAGWPETGASPVLWSYPSTASRWRATRIPGRPGGGLRAPARPHATELADETATVETWFDALTVRPDIVLVHDFRVAAALRVHVASESGPPLMILTGHDHRQHVDRTGDVVEVDGGTLGRVASSPSGTPRPGSPRCA